MKKWCLIVAILLFVVLCLSSCGYNSVMCDYLSDADHYKTYTATVVDIKRESQSAVLYVIFSSKTEIAPFYGVSENELKNAVVAKTIKILEKNKDSLSVDFPISIDKNGKYKYTTSSDAERLRF